MKSSQKPTLKNKIITKITLKNQDKFIVFRKPSQKIQWIPKWHHKFWRTFLTIRETFSTTIWVYKTRLKPIWLVLHFFVNASFCLLCALFKIRLNYRPIVCALTYGCKFILVLPFRSPSCSSSMQSKKPETREIRASEF